MLAHSLMPLRSCPTSCKGDAPKSRCTRERSTRRRCSPRGYLALAASRLSPSMSRRTSRNRSGFWNCKGLITVTARK